MPMERRRENGAPLAAFFALSLFAWVIWLSQAAHAAGLVPWAPSLSSPLNALTVWSPGLAAMFLSWRMSGKPGIRSLFSSLARWRIPARWYAAALALPPLLWGLAFGIDRLAGRSYELGPALLVSTFSAATAFMVPVAVVFTLPNALGEELGWRAFALPRMQERWGPLWASVGLGLFWGFWHVPARIAWADGAVPAVSLLAMMVNAIPAAILFTWLFNRTGGSLPIVCLHHAAITNTGYFLPGLPTRTADILLWLVAVAVVAGGGLAGPWASPSAATVARTSRPSGSTDGRAQAPGPRSSFGSGSTPT